jgi:ABC-type uncharacterized transport system substrate-binding protein
MLDTKRREFIALLGAGGLLLAVKVRRARAQQPTMPVVGFLNAASPDTNTDRLRAFRQGLKEIGFIEGENVAVEYRWAENQFDRLPTLAAELVRRQVAVIVATGGSIPALAAKAATTTVPIVFTVPEDPVRFWSCRQPCPAGRQCDRHQFFQCRVGGKAAGNPSRDRPRNHSHCRAH